MIPLSVLDLSPVAIGSSGAAALWNSLDLARLADRLGYTRYCVAEHHNFASIASSAPDIMIGQIAAVTQCMRVGSGGVMLPNHAPLMVAERFKVLEALFPGRIDLGLGRAPGTDPVTSSALRRRQGTAEEDDFLQRFQELLLFENSAFPEGHPFRSVHAMPQDVKLPPIWLLGSSGYSAQLAGTLGAGFSFAHHFANYDAVSAMLSCRDAFKPSATRASPYVILACAVHGPPGRTPGLRHRCRILAPPLGSLAERTHQKRACRALAAGQGRLIHSGEIRRKTTSNSDHFARVTSVATALEHGMTRPVVHQFEAKRSGAPRRYEPEKRAARELWSEHVKTCQAP